MFLEVLSRCLFLVLFLSGNATAYPSGAPTKACSDLTPIHMQNKPQTTDPVYTVVATPSGDSITVKIASPYGEEFQGFVMQARSAQQRNRLIEGKFSTRSNLSKTIDCGNGRQNTITQTNKISKREVVTEWTPEPGVDEEIIFRATVAQTFVTFWTGIDSKPLAARSSKSKQSQSQKSDDMYDNCFVNKGCFGYPPDCVTRRECDIFLSYVDSSDGVSFTMHGDLSSNKYMATGLSLDREMGDDSVTECFIDKNRVVVQHSWNKEKTNSPLTLVPEGMYEWRIQDRKASCSWTRPYYTTVNGRAFDLKNEKYYVLMAKGPVSDGHVSYHDGRLSSQESVNFTAYEMIAGAGAHDAVKVHGTFMVTGWIAFVSLAILMARHFKNVWENKMVFGVKIWFAVHRGFMVIALLFVVIAFIVIFVHRRGWNYETKNPHAVLGCIATALGVIQPFMAAFRPSPDHPKRPIFNWLHFAVGNGAQIIAIVTIFFAVSLDESGLEENFYWVMGVFVVVYYCFHFIFQLHSYSLDKKKNNDMIKMQEIGSGRANNGHGNQSKSLSPDVVRILLLGIYCIFLTIIMLTLYALIGTA